MTSLNKYNGSWTISQANHLLRRSTFGVNSSILDSFVSKGLDKSIDSLFEDIALPSPPLNVGSVDPYVPIGQTWVDKTYEAGVSGYKRASLFAWSIEQIFKGEANIREKMTLFWHNHFVTADINDSRLSYYYITLLRRHAIGNFKQLTKDITIDPAMLNYLNGRDNTKQAPNENFARELMELFTLGKGEQVGPGDYTTFTEQDVKEIARALTGWIDSRLVLPPAGEFRIARHDTGSKTLSHRFNNRVINNASENEYKDVIDIIFSKPEVEKFIAAKLYKWFVNPKIDTVVNQNIIIPLAAIIREDDFSIKRALKTLLSSEHFYDECNNGVIIKNPIEFVAQIINTFSVEFVTDPVARQTQMARTNEKCNELQMALFRAPSVAGWSAFYQEPALDGLWLNSSTLPSRKTLTDDITGLGLAVNGRVKIDYIKYLDKIKEPDNVNKVLDYIILHHFSKMVAPNQKTVLRNLLLNGWTEANWTQAYQAYLATPTVESKKAPLIDRMKSLMTYMMRMPEYHLT